MGQIGWVNAAGLILFFGGLALAAVCDGRTRRIPDLALIPVAAAAVVLLATGYTPWRGAVMIFLLLSCAFIVTVISDYDAVGGGDIKLMLAAGVAAGAAKTALALLFALLVFSVMCGFNRGARKPFAPPLAIGYAAAFLIVFLLNQGRSA